MDPVTRFARAVMDCLLITALCVWRMRIAMIWALVNVMRDGLGRVVRCTKATAERYASTTFVHTVHTYATSARQTLTATSTTTASVMRDGLETIANSGVESVTHAVVQAVLVHGTISASTVLQILPEMQATAVSALRSGVAMTVASGVNPVA
jgi:hypothetical protein